MRHQEPLSGQSLRSQALGAFGIESALDGRGIDPKPGARIGDRPELREPKLSTRAALRRPRHGEAKAALPAQQQICALQQDATRRAHRVHSSGETSSDGGCSLQTSVHQIGLRDTPWEGSTQPFHLWPCDEDGRARPGCSHAARKRHPALPPIRWAPMRPSEGNEKGGERGKRKGKTQKNKNGRASSGSKTALVVVPQVSVCCCHTCFALIEYIKEWNDCVLCGGRDNGGVGGGVFPFLFTQTPGENSSPSGTNRESFCSPG